MLCVGNIVFDLII